jgi:hypothetical protein
MSAVPAIQPASTRALPVSGGPSSIWSPRCRNVVSATAKKIQRAIAMGSMIEAIRMFAVVCSDASTDPRPGGMCGPSRRTTPSTPRRLSTAQATAALRR